MIERQRKVWVWVVVILPLRHGKITVGRWGRASAELALVLAAVPFVISYPIWLSLTSSLPSHSLPV